MRVSSCQVAVPEQGQVGHSCPALVTNGDGILLSFMLQDMGGNAAGGSAVVPYLPFLNGRSKASKQGKDRLSYPFTCHKGGEKTIVSACGRGFSSIARGLFGGVMALPAGVFPCRDSCANSIASGRGAIKCAFKRFTLQVLRIASLTKRCFGAGHSKCHANTAKATWNGAPRRIRTADLLFTKQLLYRLSYWGFPARLITRFAVSE